VGSFEKQESMSRFQSKKEKRGSPSKGPTIGKRSRRRGFARRLSKGLGRSGLQGGIKQLHDDPQARKGGVLNLREDGGNTNVKLEGVNRLLTACTRKKNSQKGGGDRTRRTGRIKGKSENIKRRRKALGWRKKKV